MREPVNLLTTNRRFSSAETWSSMCNLYTMTATVEEMRRAFGPFTGDTANLPPFDEI